MQRKLLFSVLLLFAWGVAPHVSAKDHNISEIRNDLIPKDLKRVQKITQPTTDFTKTERFEAMQGGAGTSLKLVNQDAFSQFSANLTFEEEMNFKLGNALFRKLWVSSPSSTHASDGLGPLFNARACQSCHIKDGRGHPPEGDTDATSMFLRLARAPQNDAERQALADYVVQTLPDPNYGGQLQDLAVPGLSAEGSMVISYEETPLTLKDGTVISLRKPSYKVDNLGFGDLHPLTTLSPRVTPQMIGLGLIEAIHASDILALADPEDKNSDGISGKPQYQYNADSDLLELGRFGWKAQNATVEGQSAGAFSGDIGISSPLAMSPYGDCTDLQEKCREFPTGVQPRLGQSEAPDPVLELVTFYSENLAVPQRRNVDEAIVLHGKELFYNSGCIACHTPKFVTSRKAKNKAQKFQLIWPYSDFLLHDMGEGLADNQPVGTANGQEWRTPPLWGIGLTEIVSGHTFFLHDGRARNLTEAILWHGGEAQKSRDVFASMEKSERNALISFLESL